MTGLTSYSNANGEKSWSVAVFELWTKERQESCKLAFETGDCRFGESNFNESCWKDVATRKKAKTVKAFADTGV